jgi:hypothetical protein
MSVTLRDDLLVPRSPEQEQGTLLKVNMKNVFVERCDMRVM